MKVRAHRIDYEDIIDEMRHADPPMFYSDEYKAGEDYYGHDFHYAPPPPGC